LRQCEACFAIFRTAPVCPACGHQHEAARAAPEQVSGDLERIDGERAVALRQGNLLDLLRAARSRDDVEAIRLARGYKPGWTWHVLRERRPMPEAAA
jgi:hypothetical protein